MDIRVRIECNCESFADIPISKSKYTKDNEFDLSESIEQNSSGLFYCSQNYPDGMDINCVICGNVNKMTY